MRKMILSTLLLIGFNNAAHAADENNRFALKGAGFLPCAVFSEERNKRTKAYYMAAGWLEGYISAHNQYNQDTYDLASFETLELLLNVVDTHCQSNPQDRLFRVMASIVQQLHPQRVSSESTKLEIVDGHRKAKLYRETVRRMQFRLQELGLFHDTVDGRYTDATKSALIAFQSDLEFEETGFPDQATLWRLFRQ